MNPGYLVTKHRNVCANKAHPDPFTIPYPAESIEVPYVPKQLSVSCSMEKWKKVWREKEL